MESMTARQIADAIDALKPIIFSELLIIVKALGASQLDTDNSKQLLAYFNCKEGANEELVELD